MTVANSVDTDSEYTISGVRFDEGAGTVSELVHCLVIDSHPVPSMNMAAVMTWGERLASPLS